MDIFRGVAFKVTAILLFTVMASLIKASSAHVPAGQAVFFRSLFAMPVILIWLAMRHELTIGLRTSNPMGHVWRGLIGVTAMGCGFAALGLLPLPEVTALGFAAPLITVILAALLLGERLRLFRLSAVGLGLIGVTVVLWPRLSFGANDIDQLAALGVALVLISAALRALAQVHVRRLVQTEQTAAVVFYFSMTATIMSMFSIPFGWVIPRPSEAAMLIGAGVIGGVAQIFLTTSYRFAGAAVLAPFDYVSILFAIVIGYFVFAEVPTSATLVGSAIVIAAGVLIIWRERQLGLKRGAARPGVTPQG
ncbi:MAG: DMT family transporter [Rhodobacteraceae bacterium]|nr:DMT family transporter [Paracoccaceae bacterium]